MKIIQKEILISGIVKIYFKLDPNYLIWIKMNNNVKIECGSYINRFAMQVQNIVQEQLKKNKLIKLPKMFQFP